MSSSDSAVSWSPQFAESIRRQLPTVALFSCASLLVALGYLSYRHPTYTASTLLVVESRVLHTLPNAVFTTPAPGGANIQTEIEILKSPKIAGKALELIPLPELESAFTSTPSPITPIRRFLLGTPVALADEASSSGTGTIGTLSMVERLQRHLQVRRLGGTSVIEVLGTAASPQAAANIANAVGQAYLADQAEANAGFARSASAWLRDQVKGAGTSARVLSEASPPSSPDGPRALSVIAAALLLGSAGGTAAGVGLELLRRRVRVADEASALTGVECFGELPKTSHFARTAPHRQAVTSGSGGSHSLGISSQSYIGPREFSDVIRKIGVAITVENPGVMAIGVTSPCNGEGKSLVALSLAKSLIAGGQRVVLVDATFSERTSTQDDRPIPVSSPPVKRTKGEGDSGPNSCAGSFLRIASLGETGREGALFWIRDAASCLPEMLQTCDIAVFDLPSIQKAAHDVRAAAHRLDGLLLVLEKGRHSPRTLVTALDSIGSGRDRLFGVVLNNVPCGAFRLARTVRR